MISVAPSTVISPLQGKRVDPAGLLPVPEPDLFNWTALYDLATGAPMNCRVYTEVRHGINVCTSFPALDHDFIGSECPLPFETVVRGGGLDRVNRYSAWREAEEGHKRTVRHVRHVLNVRHWRRNWYVRSWRRLKFQALRFLRSGDRSLVRPF